MPLRIAHFVQRYPPALGGSEAYVARLSRYLVDHGDQVTVFTTAANSLDAFWSPRGDSFAAGISTIDGVEVRRYPLSLRFRGRRWLLKPLSLIPHRDWQCLTLPCNPLSWAMRRDCAQGHHNFDIVHATAFPYAFPIDCARHLARRLDVPFFLTPFLHLGDPANPSDPTRRAYTSPALMTLARSAYRVFAQTPSERDALIQHGVLKEKIILQGLGVDPRECTGGDRMRVRREWGIADDEVVIGHLANNSAEKGTIDLLKATALMLKLKSQIPSPKSQTNSNDKIQMTETQNPHAFEFASSDLFGISDLGFGISSPFRLVLAGPEMPSFRDYCNRHAPGAVLRLGPLTDSQKRDFFAGIDLFCLPSRSDSFGLVLLEAWANGIPNICYLAGGIADLIHHGQDGLLAPCGNVPALANALQRMITNRELRFEMGAKGQRRVENEFGWKDKLDLVRDAYVRATSPPNLPAPLAFHHQPPSTIH